MANLVLKSFSVGPMYVSILLSLLSHNLFVVRGVVVVSVLPLLFMPVCWFISPHTSKIN